MTLYQVSIFIALGFRLPYYKLHLLQGHPFYSWVSLGSRLLASVEGTFSYMYSHSLTVISSIEPPCDIQTLYTTDMSSPGIPLRLMRWQQMRA